MEPPLPLPPLPDKKKQANKDQPNHFAVDLVTGSKTTSGSTNGYQHCSNRGGGGGGAHGDQTDDPMDLAGGADDPPRSMAAPGAASPISGIIGKKRPLDDSGKEWPVRLGSVWLIGFCVVHVCVLDLFWVYTELKV